MRREPSRSRVLAGLVALAAGLWLAALFSVSSAAAQPKFPPLSGRIVDEAGLLKAEDLTAIAQDLKALEAKSTDQLVVFTTRSLQGYPIEDFGYRLGRFWQLGQKGKDNGVILIVAPNERKVRIEVGRGLEPQLTDLMTKLIIENAILPAFRRNDYSGGIRAGVRDIRDVLLGDAEAVKERARGSASRSPGSGGSPLPVLILVAFILVAVTIVWVQSRQTAYPGRAMRDRRRAGRSAAASSPWSWSAGSGGWSGGSSGSDGGGGGFSGGGGDFGGGGSSGSW